MYEIKIRNISSVGSFVVILPSFSDIIYFAPEIKNYQKSLEFILSRLLTWRVLMLNFVINFKSFINYLWLLAIDFWESVPIYINIFHSIKLHQNYYLVILSLKYKLNCIISDCLAHVVFLSNYGYQFLSTKTSIRSIRIYYGIRKLRRKYSDWNVFTTFEVCLKADLINLLFSNNAKFWQF